MIDGSPIRTAYIDHLSGLALPTRFELVYLP